MRVSRTPPCSMLATWRRSRGVGGLRDRAAASERRDGWCSPLDDIGILAADRASAASRMSAGGAARCYPRPSGDAAESEQEARP